MTIAAINPASRSDRQRKLVERAAAIADDVTEESPLVGYIVLGFYGDGSTRSAGYRPNADEHKLGQTLFEAWAKQTLESHLVNWEATSAAHDVLNGDA